MSRGKRKPRAALDFDGVLHSYRSGWTGPVPLDPPVSGAQAFCVRVLEAGYQIGVVTARLSRIHGETERALVVDGMRQWFYQHRFPPAFHRAAVFPGGTRWIEECGDVILSGDKLPAEWYLDDRAVRFEGDFDVAWERVQTATLWYAKEREGL